MTTQLLPPNPPQDPPAGDLGEVLSPYPPEPLSVTLDRIVEHNKRFVFHPHESTHHLVALWVAHTHAMSVWDWTPRLYITAPQPGCGKSMQAKVMEPLAFNGHRMAGTSAPGLFRLISAGKPTIFLDEAENQFSGNRNRDMDNVTMVVDGGYERGNFVNRSERNVSVAHETYTAMAIIGIDNGKMPETIRDRCIPLRMRPGGSLPERYRAREHSEFVTEVQTRLAEAALDWRVVETPFNMRHADLWEPLWSVAHAAGGEWPARVKAAADHHTWDQKASVAARTLAAVRDYFREHDVDRVASSMLAAHVTSFDDLPTMSAKTLAKVMQGYRVYPTKSNGVMTYWRKSLQPVFAEWL